MMTRATFLTSGAAFGALPFTAFGETGRRPNLRLGVLSDIHMKGAGTEAPLEKALRIFDALKVDGVACCGDLATSGLVDELLRVGDTWKRVFPNNRRSDGAPVENLFVFGDHDMGGYAWIESRGLLPDEELKRRSIPNCDPAALWEKCFGEKWSPVAVKTVNGYPFVLAHHPVHTRESKGGNFIPGVKETLQARRAEFSGDRPFFYLQHRLLRNTAGGKIAWGQDSGEIRAQLEAFPNCFALMGHGHITCTDERVIWQGPFTALETPSLRYCSVFSGCENSALRDVSLPNHKEQGKRMIMPPLRPRDARQGFLLDVYDRRIVIRRMDFVYSDGERLAADWIVPLPLGRLKPYSFDFRRANEKAPRFPAGAALAVRQVAAKTRGGTPVACAEISFPPARSSATSPRANRYEITARAANGQKTAREVYSSKIHLAESFDGGRVKCLIALDELPGDLESTTFSVRPVAPFGTKGSPIS